jgi:hypothetical protein
MKNKYEIRLAWKIWNITYYFNDLLWDRYGDHFLEYHLKQKTKKKNEDFWEHYQNTYDPPF